MSFFPLRTAVNSLTGMLTRPKLIDPDQIACAMLFLIV
jgi:hypothetical protein